MICSKFLLTVPKESLAQPKAGHPKPQNVHERNVTGMLPMPKQDDHEIDMSRLESLDMMFMPPSPPPPPPPPPSLPVDKVIVKPIVPAEPSTVKPSTKTQKLLTSARSFTIASLQQYTNSFSQENLIGSGMLGSVYRAQLPNGKVCLLNGSTLGNLLVGIFYWVTCCIILLICWFSSSNLFLIFLVHWFHQFSCMLLFLNHPEH